MTPIKILKVKKRKKKILIIITIITIKDYIIVSIIITLNELTIQKMSYQQEMRGRNLKVKENVSNVFNGEFVNELIDLAEGESKGVGEMYQ
ncbi:MAG: hypothetical protein EZS28_029519 [Streblomastix strix]|uniref:Uncharacterized protein n=1 Tax=Streblomastix strix TaxID=222440 RepID=A0A5J4UXL0_9EUKA|nr:MAG: hypothetical protein EZS28_029519 [Streblomastix strix]